MIIDYDGIRDHYDYLTPEILRRSQRSASSWVNPYGGIDWAAMFTPIEYQTWQAIRTFGHLPMYPQYPVLGYFLDFGNPYLKIGIECDGADFHKDKEKDRLRDMALYQEGWKIYRISGSDCMRMPTDDYFEMSEIDDLDKLYATLNQVYDGTIEGLVKSLGVYYCGYNTYMDHPDEIEYVLDCLNSRISLPEKCKHVWKNTRKYTS
jgi:hypothetical protein